MELRNTDDFYMDYLLNTSIGNEQETTVGTSRSDYVAWVANQCSELYFG